MGTTPTVVDTAVTIVWGFLRADRITYSDHDIPGKPGNAVLRARRKLAEFLNNDLDAAAYVDGRRVSWTWLPGKAPGWAGAVDAILAPPQAPAVSLHTAATGCTGCSVGQPCTGEFTLGNREALHGRSFREYDETTSTWYCTECMSDLPAAQVAQCFHVCPAPQDTTPTPPTAPAPDTTARPVKSLRRHGSDLATSRERQADGTVRYTVCRVTGDGGAVETVMFIDRDRWERDRTERYKTFIAGVWQSGGFIGGGSYAALKVGFGRTLAAAVEHARRQLAANPPGGLDA